MGSRKNWPRELADRCNAVGWEARLVNSGHYRAFLPDGRSFGWAASPSDTNGYKAAQREAERFGLADLELQARLQREKERLERIRRDRELNGVPAEDFAPEPTQPKEDAMPKYGFIEVDGVKLGIAEVGPAFYSPVRGGESREIPDARELLLVDETIRYQCLKPTHSDPGRPDKLCERTFEKAAGLHIHQGRMHRNQPGQPDLSKLEILADTKPQAVYTTPAPPRAEPNSLTPGVMARAVRLAEGFAAFNDQLGDLADLGDRLSSDLQELARMLPTELVSDELRSKAEKFDAMLRAARGLDQ